MILAAGFSGIADITWDGGMKMMNDKSEDGKPSRDISPRYKIIVSVAI
jgi:hypothetical protein